MPKIDKVIWKETGYIAAWTLVLSAMMQAVFLVVGYWDYTVLLGNAWSAVVSVLNFFLMGLVIQSMIGKEEKEIKQAVRASAGLRLLGVFLLTVLGVVLPGLHDLAVLIPLLFPRIAIAVRPILDKRKAGNQLCVTEKEGCEDADTGSVLPKGNSRGDENENRPLSPD